jgi:malonyl CoA-acyl carrier protein transacylase
MTHRESRCRANIAVFVVPALATTPVTMSRDPIFESVTKDAALIEDDARETAEIWLTSGVQWFLVGG